MGQYTLTNAEYWGLKAKLTRAINSKDNDKILKVCEEAMNIFAQKGYPDSWYDWERAKRDVEFNKSLQR